jgi:hypothetical protein
MYTITTHNPGYVPEVTHTRLTRTQAKQLVRRLAVDTVGIMYVVKSSRGHIVAVTMGVRRVENGIVISSMFCA